MPTYVAIYLPTYKFTYQPPSSVVLVTAYILTYLAIYLPTYLVSYLPTYLPIYLSTYHSQSRLASVLLMCMFSSFFLLPQSLSFSASLQLPIAGFLCLLTQKAAHEAEAQEAPVAIAVAGWVSTIF
jgi:hypothetical protein